MQENKGIFYVKLEVINIIKFSELKVWCGIHLRTERIKFLCSLVIVMGIRSNQNFDFQLFLNCLGHFTLRLGDIYFTLDMHCIVIASQNASNTACIIIIT